MLFSVAGASHSNRETPEEGMGQRDEDRSSAEALSCRVTLAESSWQEKLTRTAYETQVLELRMQPSR